MGVFAGVSAAIVGWGMDANLMAQMFRGGDDVFVSLEVDDPALGQKGVSSVVYEDSIEGPLPQ